MKTDIGAKEAVEKSIKFIYENSGTGGAEALASVLLHTYDHSSQPFDITLLCGLDHVREEWAWAILKMRVDRVEPQELFDGDALNGIVEKYWLKPDGVYSMADDKAEYRT